MSGQDTITAINTGNRHFDKLVIAGNPVGTVIAVNKFLIKAKGLQPSSINALIMFEDGSKGYINQIDEDYVTIMHLGKKPIKVGSVVVLQHHELVCKVGKSYIGRVVSVTGDPLDSKGPIAADTTWPVFNMASPMSERQLLGDPLESGVVAIDSMLPIVRGQRMALLGDSKSGKSTLAAQLAANQKNTDQILIFVLIAKHRSDVETLMARLEDSGVMEKSIVVVSTIFESLALSYIAPYVGCSIAEYLWQQCDMDTVIIYDDLTAHAHAHREISLLSGVSPGRDSYPGDMFYAHSSLLERAGRLQKNQKHLTSIPIVNVAGGDFTAYLPTNIMSITDGQWILDMNIFRDGIRPAINMGTSVTRSGGIGQSAAQKALAARSLKLLAEYRQAAEYAHFGTELAIEAKRSLSLGKKISELISQAPHESFSATAQQLMLDIIVNVDNPDLVDMAALRMKAPELAVKTHQDSYESVRNELVSVAVKGGTVAKSSPVDISPPDLSANRINQETVAN